MKVSYILLSYNQEKYIKEAVVSAFNQNYSDIQFIFSDDCSPDSTFNALVEVVNEVDDPREVIINRNEINLGLVGNLNKCLSLATGDIFVLAAGDDIAHCNRVQRTVNYFANNKNLMTLSFNDAIFTGNIESSESMYPIASDIKFSLNEVLNYGEKNIFSGASRAYRRIVYDNFGGISNKCPTEDSTFLLRAVLCGEGLVSKDIGVYYRWHGLNLSSEINLRKMDINSIFDQYAWDLNHARIIGLIDENDYLIYSNELQLNYDLRRLQATKGLLERMKIIKNKFFLNKKIRKKFFLKFLDKIL